MSKTVYGVYDTTAEVLRAIHALRRKGYDSYEISVVAQAEEPWDFAALYRKADIQAIEDDEEHRTFLEKVKRWFTGEDRDLFRERLVALGVGDGDIDDYLPDLHAGKLLVLVESARAAGQLPPYYPEAVHASRQEAAAAGDDAPPHPYLDGGRLDAAALAALSEGALYDDRVSAASHEVREEDTSVHAPMSNDLFTADPLMDPAPAQSPGSRTAWTPAERTGGRG
ncbi:general stress protein [Paenibacillus methanolicus]|uniref:Heat induced stress protein YflT n=1 Tax=Paenibacillus methanolicus TaxID=582686 RepID=A0A5S5BT61_9BACL|nr:general stress protein [Paenibacillus methanolicus]TYP70229.1 heat induced stress protein YflT [Paenibacillus methanolicus]